MSILTAENLELSYGAFDVFRGISINISNDSKIGLIGPNGIGKTSLMLILAGFTAPTRGRVHIARGRKIGYLRQEAVDAFADRHNTVYAEMLTVFAGLQQMQAGLNEMEARMSAGDSSAALLEDYGRLLEDFERLGGYDFDIRIQQTLEGLGLGKSHWNMPLNHLSGGQKNRALLARLLLEKPDLLILDEPTNHLDIDAVEWLEHTLNSWDGAVLIVSHDRFFLDNTVNVIWEMSRSQIETYTGNYSAYLLQRQEHWEYTERVYTEEKERLLKDVDFIQRNWVRASTHHRALGLLKKVSRELSIIEHYGLMTLRSGKQWSEMELSADRPLDVIEAIRKVNAIEIPQARPAAIRPHLHPVNPGSMIVLRANHVTVGYPNKPLFSTHELELRRGECAALMGPNGSGKTTFLKVLLGQMQPLQGEVYVGGSLKVGYFAQAHDALTGTHSVLEELQRHKPMLPEAARSYLAQYLFRGDDVFKPVNALSGGERARLALGIMALDGANVLLLDEPTNHLDIPAREAIQAMLESYNGTILLVSHDRFLIDQLATQVWELRDHKLQIFKGTYREFILRRRSASTSPAQRTLLTPKPMVRDNSKETRRKVQALGMLEDRIRQQEAAVQKLSNELQKAGEALAFEHVNQLSAQFAQAQAALDQLMEEWEKTAA